MSRTFIRNHRQSGAALIVGLVLMTVLTLLAVSTMRTATLELAMAGNTQYHEQAVQLAEAGIDDAVRRISALTLPLQVQDGWSTSFTETVDIEGIEQGRYEVAVNYLSCGTPPEGSQVQNQAIFFEIESTGFSVARGARSSLVQGFWRYHPKCPPTAG